MLRKYAKAVVAAVTGAVNVGGFVLLDATAQADTWVTALLLAAANLVGTVVVAKVKNAGTGLRNAAENYEV